MRKMKIISKRQADKMIIDSLFCGGQTLSSGRYDMGKYSPGKYVGKEVEIPDNFVDIIALYPVPAKDRNGAYVKIYSVKNTKTGAASIIDAF
jgi:hypothetical protein